MEPKLNPFDILNISQNSTENDIKERWLLVSKTFHPDRQPPEHRDMAASYFQRFEKAYRSISTSLQKYVFYKFGAEGIELLQRYHQQFNILQGKQKTIQGKQEIDQLILNLHFTDRRQYFDDQGKVDASVVVDLSPMFHHYHKEYPSVAYPFPTTNKINSNYSFAAPSLLNFQNNGVFQFSSGPSTRSFGVGLLSTRRLYEHFLLKNFAAYSDSGFYESLSIEYIHSPTFTVKVVPLVYSNGDFTSPRISLDKRLQSDVNFNANTNGQQYNASLYISGKTKESMNTNIDLSFRDSMQIQLQFDFYLSNFCRFIVHLNQTYVTSTSQLGISYGIMANLTEDTKILALSHVHAQNLFEIKITSGKYNMRIPIVCSSLHWSQFQLIKLGAIVGLYLGCRLFKHYHKNNSVKKQIQKAKSSLRLNADESKLMVTIAEIQHQQIQNLRFETLSRGLIILAAYVGSQRQINKVSRRIKRKKIDFDINHISRIRGQLEFTLQQVVNVTKLIQILVKGARIENKLLKVYNPCYDEEQRPVLYIYYNLRGQTNQLIQSVDKEINIGLPNKSRDNILTNIITWFRKVNIIF